SVRRNHGSPTVSTRVLQHNREKADKQQASREVRFVPHKQTHPLQKRGVAMIYSITLSARRTSPAGISCPISFATSTLTTNSNLVGCSTGRSPGLAPRKILST